MNNFFQSERDKNIGQFFSRTQDNIMLSSSNENICVMTKDQFDLFKCELCDDHIKRRFIEIKDTFFKIFKNYIKFIKLIKNKDDTNLKKLIEETGNAQKEFLLNRSLLEKILAYRLSTENMEYNRSIILLGIDEKERKEFYDDLNNRKESLKRFRKNVMDLEALSKNIQDAMEVISLSNSLIN